MSKMTVTVNGAVVKSTSKVNDAFNFAGDHAHKLLYVDMAPVGTTVVVTRDGTVVLTRTMVEETVFGNVRRAWKQS